MKKSAILLAIAGVMGLTLSVLLVNQQADSVSVDEETPFLNDSCQGDCVGMANPAAVYCTQLGYQYKIITEKDGSQRGECIFNKKEKCSAWRFLEGQCGIKYNYCSQLGYKTKVKTDGKNGFSPTYAVCTKGRREIDSVTTLFKLDEKANTKGKVEEIQFEKEIKKDKKQSNLKTRTLPSSFDWRNYKDQDWTTPVKDQGVCDSCSAFSALGAMEATHNIRSGNASLNLDLAEEYLISTCYPTLYCNTGGYAYLILPDIVNSGITTEQYMSYVSYSCDGDDCSTCEHYPDYCSNTICEEDLVPGWDSNLEYINETSFYWDDFGTEDIKEEIIEKGPISADMCFGDHCGVEWIEVSEGTTAYTCSNPGSYGNHEVVIVGYDDEGQYWIVKNSYGADWNENATDGYFNVAYNNCLINQLIVTNDLTDTDQDTIGDIYDNCPNTFNPAQGDIDGDGIGDACDYEDTAFFRLFTANYTDTEGTNFDYQMGGGPCNVEEGCDYSQEQTDYAFCNGPNYPNYCVYQGTCYEGDGSVILDIDGSDFEKHQAICVGFGWWDLDSGTEVGDTPLPGIEVCEMGGYTWAESAEGPTLGEYEWNYNGYGCCGDDEGEHYWTSDGLCHSTEEVTRIPGPVKRPLVGFFR